MLYQRFKILRNNTNILIFKYNYPPKRIEIFEEMADPTAREEMYRMSLKHLIRKTRNYQRLLLGLYHKDSMANLKGYHCSHME